MIEDKELKPFLRIIFCLSQIKRKKNVQKKISLEREEVVKFKKLKELS